MRPAGWLLGLLLAGIAVRGAVAQEHPFLDSVVAAANAHDLPKLGELLEEAAARPVGQEFTFGGYYFKTASHYLQVLRAGSAPSADLVVRLRPAFECARRWAGSSVQQSLRDYAADHAACLGCGIIDELRANGAGAAELLELAASIPIVRGQLNGVIACVQRADILLELGRTAATQTVLDAIDVAAIDEETRPNGTALVAACRADLDVHLGNHDEALRRLLPWLQCANLLPLIRLRILRTHIGYLLAAARFDEVPAAVDAAQREPSLSPAEQDLFEFYRLVAAAADTGLDDLQASALVDRFGAMVTHSPQPYLRRWAAIVRARLLCRDEAGEPDAAIAAARAQCTEGTDLPARQYLETTAAAVLLRAHDQGKADPAHLRRQFAELDKLCQQMRGDRADAPSRPSGVGFLHYTFRRDIVAQRFGLAVALDDSPRGREAATDLLLQGYEEKASLQRLRTDALGGDDHGVLVYLPGGDASYVVAIDRRHITWKRLAGTRVLHGGMRRMEQRLVEALALTEAAADTDLEGRRMTCVRQLEETAASLTAQLLPESIRAAMGKWRRLSLFGSEMLPLVPFESLPFEGKALGQRFAIDRWPNLGFAIGRAGATRIAGDLRLAFFGKLIRSSADVGLSPVYVEQWLAGYRNPFVQCESRCTVKALSGVNPLDVLVVLAHGERRADRVRPHVLRFADGDFGCEEVEQLAAVPRFVVLAACNAALGPSRFGAPTRADLTGSFLARGAWCVAASPFALRLEPTRAILAAALPALTDGASPAEAMRLARDELWRRSATPQARLDSWTTGALAVFGYGQGPLR